MNVWPNHAFSTAARPRPGGRPKDLSTEPYLPETENPDDVDEDLPAMFSVMGNYDTEFKEMSWELEHDGRTHAPEGARHTQALGEVLSVVEAEDASCFECHGVRR